MSVFLPTLYILPLFASSIHLSKIQFYLINFGQIPKCWNSNPQLIEPYYHHYLLEKNFQHQIFLPLCLSDIYMQVRAKQKFLETKLLLQYVPLQDAVARRKKAVA